jgi:hypothetical protein
LLPPCALPGRHSPRRTPKTLIRDVVQKLQGRGNAEAERLRAAMRKAMAVLQAALDAEPRRTRCLAKAT